MTQADRYFIGPGLRDKLRDVIRRVDGDAYGGGGGKIPTRLQDMRGRGGGSVRLCKTTEPWPVGTVANLDVWEKITTPNETPNEALSDPGESITATNHQYDVAACVWVLVGKAANGIYYLLDAATPDGTEGCDYKPNVAGHDLTTVTGYDASKKQALTHDNGCLKWMDIETCSE